MDRVNQLRDEAGGSRDSSLDSSSLPTDSFHTANESSKYFSTFDISPIKDISLASTAEDHDKTITGSDQLLSDLSSISKKNDLLDSYKIGEHIEAANILSGGVDIFDDNDNSYDNDLVIDDNVGMDLDDDPNSQINKLKDQIKELDTVNDTVSETVNDTMNDPVLDTTLTEGEEATPSVDSGVLLQIDGRNVDAIDIGNGLYLYRTDDDDELAAVQIIENKPNQTEFKFLKVRPNKEGNLEVYEEIEIEVPSDAPRKQKSNKTSTKTVPATETSSQDEVPAKQEEEKSPSTSKSEPESLKFDGAKCMKFNESRKSPLTFHSTPTKEGIPLTKSMVDKHLDPNRHAENKKTIEVKSDNSKQKLVDKNTKNDFTDTFTKDEVTIAPKVPSTEIDEKSQGDAAKVLKPDKITLTKEESKDLTEEIVKEKLSEEKNIETKDVPSSMVGAETVTKIEKINSELQLKNEDKTTVNFIEESIAPAIISAKINFAAVVGDSKFESKSTDSITPELDTNPKRDEIKMNDSKTSTSTQSTKLKSNKEEITKDNKIIQGEVTVQCNQLENASQEEETPKSNQNTVLKTLSTEKLEHVKDIKTIQEPKSTKDLAKIESVIEENLSKNQEKLPTQKVEDSKLSQHQTSNSKESYAKKPSITPKPSQSVELTKVKQTKPEIDTIVIKDDSIKDKHGIVIKEDENRDKKSIPESKTIDEKVRDEVDNVTVTDIVKRIEDYKPKNYKIPSPDKIESKVVKDSTPDFVNPNKEPMTATLTKKPQLVSPQVLEDKSIEKKIVKTKSEPEVKLMDKTQEKLPETTDKDANKNTTKDLVPEIKKSPKATIAIETNKTIPDEIRTSPENLSTTQTYLNHSSDNKPQITQTQIINKEDIVIIEDETEKPKPKLVESINLTKDIPPLAPIQKTQDNKHVKLPLNPVVSKPTLNVIQAKSSAISDTFKNISQIKPLTPVEVSNSTITLDKNAADIKTTGMNQSDSPTQPSSASCDLINLDDLGVTQKKIESDNMLHFMHQDYSIMNTHKNIVSIGKAQSDIKSTKMLTSPFKSIEQASSMKHDFKLTPVTITKPTQPKTLLDNDFINECVSKAAIIRGVPFKGDSKMMLTPMSKSSAFHPVGSKTVPATKPAEKNDSTIANRDVKSLNNNNAVPFGKWTEANKQAYLSKIRETKVPTNSSNSNQLKQANDLNRRDVLKKIDSQRQSSINATTSRLPIKTETIVTKVTVKPDTKVPIKAETSGQTPVTETVKPSTKTESGNVQTASCTSTTPTEEQTDAKPNNEISFKSLIDRTIEDILMDRKAPSRDLNNEWNQEGMKSIETEWQGLNKNAGPKPTQAGASAAPTSSTLKMMNDDLEMKLSELHGVPFGDKTGQDSGHKSNCDFKVYSKPDHRVKQPIFTKHGSSNQPNIITKPLKCTRDLDSDEEIIEHVPITGDLDINKRYYRPISTQNKRTMPPHTSTSQNIDLSKKDPGITEKDFARRNSMTYENSLTVNYDEKKFKGGPIIISNPPAKLYSKNINSEPPTPPAHKPSLPNPRNLHLNKMTTNANKYVHLRHEEMFNRNPQTKFQIAYNSALTAKRQKESPITVIQDKPVKVIYMDNTTEFVPSKLNAQGQELSPAKKGVEPESVTIGSCDLIESENTDYSDQLKMPDTKKNKHQRKQVLTPTESPLEVVEPKTDESPKKKRKVEEIVSPVPEKSPKSMVPKKSYLLGRAAPPNDRQNEQHKPVVESPIENKTASAIDSLVKAAELLDNQSNMSNPSPTGNTSVQSISSQGDTPTPVKRGRGRPRKYPLPDGVRQQPQTPSPPIKKRPEVVRAKKKDTSSEESSSEDDDMIQENWSMGKINENIVCPICNKLFRSENVVFKHVKHCTGPSPNRSESDKSSRRGTSSLDIESSQDSRDSMFDKDYIPSDSKKSDKPKKTSTTPKQGVKDNDEVILVKDTPAEVIVIEDTPVKEKLDKDRKSSKPQVNKPGFRSKFNHVCDFCNKEFRQLSYLISHKLQHKNDLPKKTAETDLNSTVFTCEICKKDFRKLHYLVQHRLIHVSASAAPSKPRRKSSLEQTNKDSKHVDDQSAGFRCEPCDKSFRKLHHLVEHRETHDGINRQKTVTQPVTEKPEQTTPVCDICQKSFRKLHHLIEHKEQHAEQSRNEEKNQKNATSMVKDIIHECSLCYMVFPNEHSLNKHAVFCARKKKQSESKQNKSDTENKDDETSDNVEPPPRNPAIEAEKAIPVVEKTNDDKKSKEKLERTPSKEQKPTEEPLITTETVTKASLKLIVEPEKSNVLHRKPSLEKLRQSVEVAKEKPNVAKPDVKPVKAKRSISEDKSTDPQTKSTEEVPAKIRKSDSKDLPSQGTPKAKLNKSKNSATITKKHRTSNASLPVIGDVKPQSSDEEEVRYMLNPDFKEDTPDKLFMHVIAKKRNSLQIERPKETHVKRRISLQHHPKIRAKLELKPVLPKLVKDTVPSTDSDDSDVKYSFPEKSQLEVKKETLKVPESKHQKKSLTEKRKTLSGIAKRKSIGKGVTTKTNEKNTLIKMTIKKRMVGIEHRCDCGQLFNSAALLARHTSLAHTPPRIRRRRSAQEDDIRKINTKTIAKTKPAETNKKHEILESKKPKLDAQKKTIEVKKRKLETTVDAKKKSQDAETKKVKVEPDTETIKPKQGAKKPPVPTLADLKRAKTRAPEVKPNLPLEIKKTTTVAQKTKTASIVPAKKPKSLPAFITNKAKRESLSKNKISREVAAAKKTDVDEPKKAKENDPKPVKRTVGRPPKLASTMQKQKEIVKAKSDTNIPSATTLKPKRTPKKFTSTTTSKVIEGDKTKKPRASVTLNIGEKRKTIDDKSKK